MPTLEEVSVWIGENLLDASLWDSSGYTKQDKAVNQANRNLQRWYPDQTLTAAVVSFQAIWELQALDPALKFQRQGVKQVSDRGESISYGDRDKVAPEVRDIFGAPVDQLMRLEGGELR
jgi:hypothetical protein